VRKRISQAHSRNQFDRLDFCRPLPRSPFAMSATSRLRRLAAVVLLPCLLGGASRAPASDDPVIRRTEFGVAHIEATTFRGVGIGLGYTQAEDYRERVVLSLLRAKGYMGRTFGKDSMESDFAAMRVHVRVQQTYHLLDADTRAMYDGFAEGVNRFIRANRTTLPAWVQPVFHGHDVAAGDIGTANTTAARNLVQRWLRRDSLTRTTPPEFGASLDLPDVADRPILGSDADVGSNAWALAPSRTTSGRAILLRNPHLNWNAGYWEAHVTLPGKLDFYGDFRIGSAFSVVGGFNAHLGWATTNNATDLDEVYELALDAAQPDHYLFDGASVPVRYEEVAVVSRDADTLITTTRRYATTPLGPVVHRTSDKLYIVRAGPEGEYRAGAQFLAMMRARTLAEWKQALAIRARATSNLTYADRAGTILTIWMASIPRLPHHSGRDSVPIPARTSADIWTRLITLDSLPQTQNPPGGYVHNENDAPHFANLRALLDTARYPDNVERGELRLRSQLALQLIANSRRFSLEDVVRQKHSMRMLLADRVKPALLAAVKRSPVASDSNAVRAAAILTAWNNTVAPDSRGGVLFETFWRRYQSQARDSAFAEKWSWARLTQTPRGLGQPDKAVDALLWAITETTRKYGRPDVAWGDVHRVRRGTVDVPVGGCSGALGCFRVLTYEEQADGKRAANSGDGWVLAVEFGPRTPRAYSILAYGQSTDPQSPHHADQAAMFARGEFKPVRFTAKDVVAHTIRQYTPSP
jgi:acyl-homoserine-lactone acylase